MKQPIFYHIDLPHGRRTALPTDIEVRLPETEAVLPERLHLLAYIPWDDVYLEQVPKNYRHFFAHVVPSLNARTTDVHTALSLSHVPRLIADTDSKVDEHVLHLAVILHDSGWPHLSEEQIANSLDYSSVAYSEQALEPKRLHATLGADAARRLMESYPDDLGLTGEQRQYICDLVYYHDQIRPWPADENGSQPIEYLLLGDADRLWSYTYENFWLDTIRKNVAPLQYACNLEEAIDDYFLTDQGRTIARELIAERHVEAELAEAFLT